MNFVFRLLILLSMFFCHIFADYNLQGILASMKQKEWWRKQTTRQIYHHDYKMAMLEHAFAWSFVMELPLTIIAIVQHNVPLMWLIVVTMVFNTAIHNCVDHWKANIKVINLIEDQTIHFVQIILTWIVAMGAL